MSEAVVEVKNLCKSYGKIKAVDDISFEVSRIIKFKDKNTHVR